MFDAVGQRLLNHTVGGGADTARNLVRRAFDGQGDVVSTALDTLDEARKIGNARCFLVAVSAEDMEEPVHVAKAGASEVLHRTEGLDRSVTRVLINPLSGPFGLGCLARHRGFQGDQRQSVGDRVV